METTSFQQQRKRKVLLVLPMLVLPFITILFWTLGGGQASAGTDQEITHKGFNPELPDAKLKDEQGLGKMGYYDRAAADSAKLRQAQQTDPYARKPEDTTAHGPGVNAPDFAANTSMEVIAPVNSTERDRALKVAMIDQRLNQLRTEINRPPEQITRKHLSDVQEVDPISGLQGPTKEEDPELRQMNGILERILDIQHPQRIKDKASAVPDTEAAKKFKAIPAVIDGNQKIIQGTVIRMRLLDSVRFNGQLFEKGQLIYGSGDLYNQRVKINIKLVHAGLQIIPVDLTVFDRTDGMEGINVPEAVTGDAVRDGAVSGVQTMDVMSFDPSLGAQMATAGINTAKGLFSKKIKRVKGKLKNGHELLLRDNQRVKDSQ